MPRVVLLDLRTKAKRAILAGDVNGFRITGCWFKTDERLLCTYVGVDFDAGQPFSVSRLFSVNTDGSGGKVLVQNRRGVVAQFQDRILDPLDADPDHVLMQIDDDGDIFPTVYKVNVRTGAMRVVLRQRGPITSWLADRDGIVRFGFGYRERKGQYIARDSEQSEWRTLSKFDLFDRMDWQVLGFGSTPNALLVSASHNGRDAIWEMDLSDQNERQLLYAHPEVDVDSVLTAPRSERIVGFAFETDRPGVHWIDPISAGIDQAIKAVLPDTQNRVLGGSRDSSRLLVFAFSDVDPGSYHLLDLDARTLDRVGRRNSQLPTDGLATMQSVAIPGPDGVRIPGYLTIPRGLEPRGLPAIVLPHGGPYSRDSWGYDRLVQLLANSGYAVLQPNFRGSTGYGQTWLDAGYQGWGTVMHDDISSSARWLIEQGIADASRLCIVGWSYGGYAALIGAIKEPRLYRCAVSIAGVSDMMDLQADNSRFYGGRVATVASTGTEDLKINSPRRRAAEIMVPVLLVHGTADQQVVDDHSRVMARALSREGKTHELVIIKDGSHSLEREEWAVQLYASLRNFLARHLGPPAE